MPTIWDENIHVALFYCDKQFQILQIIAWRRRGYCKHSVRNPCWSYLRRVGNFLICWATISHPQWEIFQYMWQSRGIIPLHSSSHYLFWTAVTQYFRHGWGSYVLCKLMNTWYIYTARMSPTRNGSSTLQCFQCGNAIEISLTCMCVTLNLSL